MDRGIPGSTSHRGRLTVEVEHRGERAVITPRGELDHHTADVLRRSLDECVDAGVTDLVVDCAGLDFLDSTGLNVLLGARLTVEEKGGAVHLAAMTPVVARVFEITGAGAVFTVHDSVEEAIPARGEPSDS
ncbi:STAS domain-containing protein [Streptomyces durbertensis]|uniref:Anti-sigma factor antagonist n=1 Tax=Streptomyces durbertensis TaxID=2448886 RepID=A0ABR6EM33_9ACTN|nr:STAS domain-containing protein [Streptomyces durbertensis]MBB1246387.1 STAS domain-containing protein [Streptomyces durbertensis]